MASELCELPAWRLAEMIRRGDVSPVEVVDAHIARIEAVNPHLNALIAERFVEARREAVTAEARVRQSPSPEDLPTLLGVPCTIKEFFAVRGMTWDAGLMIRRGVRAERDATVVERLRAAGAIILGKSNVPEGGMWMETYNPVHGRTHNPWDLKRTPGGSSGGEAALIAAGASPFGIGSDIAGSIRIPSSMCGIVGHKPSELLVPNTGQWPEPTGEAERMLSSGPMGRCVRDLELVLEIIAGPDGESAANRTLPPSNGEARDLRGLRVIPVTSNGHVRITAVMRDAVARATAALAARGATVVELDDATWKKLFGKSLGAWMRGLASAGEGQSFADTLSGGERIPILAELFAIARGKPRYALPSLALVLMERLQKPFNKRLGGAPSVEELRAGFDEILGDRGVIIHPPFSRPAPRHMWPMLTPFDAVCTALFSVAGMPGTAVPVGFDERHLPVGVQIVGRRGADRLTLAAARALEEAFGGWVPAPFTYNI